MSTKSVMSDDIREMVIDGAHFSVSTNCPGELYTIGEIHSFHGMRYKLVDIESDNSGYILIFKRV